MHLSFDLYPSYLRAFEGSFDTTGAFRLNYQIHAMRHYAYRTEGGRRVGPFPQVRSEGSLALSRSAQDINADRCSLDVQHTRSWSTWTNQDHASKQTLRARLNYQNDTFGSLNDWHFSYVSEPILPVKSYRYNQLGPMQRSGQVIDQQIELSGPADRAPLQQRAHAPVTSLYSLIERLQSGSLKAGKVDYLDDLSMFRPGQELCALPTQELEINGSAQELHGYALVGPALVPLYFWMDRAKRVLAIIGHNVAYTLTEAETL